MTSGTSGAIGSLASGQPRAAASLTAALESGPAHAYLFVGPNGSGKREAARSFGAELLAVGADDPEGVRRRVMRHPSPHPDFVWVEPAGATHLVEDIREDVIRGAALRPAEGSRRVFVICEAEAMREESQNALLKTLEEPGDFAHFLLLASSQDLILPTIGSRCSVIEFSPLRPDVVVERLGAEPGDPAAVAVARLSGGDLDLARRLLDPEGSDLRQAAESAARAAVLDSQPAQPWRAMLDYATEAGERAAAEEEARLLELGQGTGRGGQKGKLRADAADQVKRTARRVRTHSLDLGLGLCAAWFRDLAAVAGGGGELAFNQDRQAELAADAEGLSAGRAAEAVALVNDTRRRLGLNVSEDLALDALWLRLGALLASPS